MISRGQRSIARFRTRQCSSLSYRQSCPETTSPPAGDSRPRRPRPCSDWRRGRRPPPLPSRSWPPPSGSHSPLSLSRTSYSLFSALIIAVCTRGGRSLPPPPQPLQGSLPRSSARFYGLPAAESKTTHSGTRIRVRSLSLVQLVTAVNSLSVCAHFHHRIEVHQGRRTSIASCQSVRRDRSARRPLLPRRLHFHTAPRQMSQHGPRAPARHRRQTDRRNCGLGGSVASDQLMQRR